MSAPLIAATAAPGLAIAFWRTGAAAAVIAPVAFARREVFTRRGLSLALLAGVVLAAHFGTFIPSLEYTSVASASALVCSQAVFAGVFGRLLGERLPRRPWIGAATGPAGGRLPRRAWIGTATCLAGVLLVTGVDASLDARALGGDLLAAAGGMFGGV